MTFVQFDRKYPGVRTYPVTFDSTLELCPNRTGMNSTLFERPGQNIATNLMIPRWNLNWESDGTDLREWILGGIRVPGNSVSKVLNI